MLAADVIAVRKIGLTAWIGGPTWPVEDSEYFEIAQTCQAAYVHALEGLSRRDVAIFMSNYPFVAFLVMHIHALLVEARCAASGIFVQHGPLSAEFANPDWEKSAEALGRQALPFSGLNRRRWMKNAIVNRCMNPFRWIAKSRRPDALGLGSSLGLKREYVRARNLYVDHTYAALLCARCRFHSERPRPGLCDATETFLQDVTRFLKSRHGIQLDDAGVQRALHGRLTTLSQAYDHILGKKLFCRQVLVSELARPLHRIAAHACRALGLEAVGFHHGNNMGGLPQTNFPFNGISSVDSFVCPTQGSSKAFEKNYLSSPMARIAPVRFLSQDVDTYERLIRSSEREPLPDQIRTVMIMGYPMNASRALSVPGNHFALHLLLEYRLIETLKKHGFRVLYKAHPERVRELGELLTAYCDEVIVQPFENVWKRADALVIKDSTSTTFGFALCLNRPIVFIDFEKDFWQAEHHRLLERRVRRVPARIQEGSRVFFDEQEFMDALCLPPEPPDMAYVERFMLSRWPSRSSQWEENT